MPLRQPGNSALRVTPVAMGRWLWYGPFSKPGITAALCGARRSILTGMDPSSDPAGLD
ncbi:MAG: hypothetical protein ACKO2P_10475 [Planctomycetota bacterium]